MGYVYFLHLKLFLRFSQVLMLLPIQLYRQAGDPACQDCVFFIDECYITDSMSLPMCLQLCKVVLNAPAQAKQHYEGKNHVRKVKMFEEGKEDDDSGQEAQVDFNNDPFKMVVCVDHLESRFSCNIKVSLPVGRSSNTVLNFYTPFSVIS